MSGGGGDKPKPVPVSAGEKIQTQLARDQIAYYRGTYAPLEKDFRDTVDQDPTARLQAQSGSASARETTQTLRDAALVGGPVNTAELGEARALSRVGAMAQGTRELADGRLDALGVGLGITADASKSLSQAGQIQTDAAIDRTRLALAKQQAKNAERAALAGAVGSLGGAYIGYKMPAWQAKQATQAKANATADRMQTKIDNGTIYRNGKGLH